MIRFVKMDSGDVALIVNDKVVMTADPSIDDPSLVESAAENLAGALDVALAVMEWQEPKADDWTWEGVAEEIAIDAAMRGQGLSASAGPASDVRASDDAVEDVVEHVLTMERRHGFRCDEDSVADAVGSSAELLGVQLDGPAVELACKRVLGDTSAAKPVERDPQMSGDASGSRLWELRKELSTARSLFEAQGGRGVDLAERIDELAHEIDVHEKALRHGWLDVSIQHAIATRNDDYPSECIVPLANGRALHCPAYPQECDYLRIVHDGCELGFWTSSEWDEAPTEVIGAVIGLAHGEGREAQAEGEDRHAARTIESPRHAPRG